MQHFTSFFIKFNSNLRVKRFFFLLNAAFSMTILYLTSHIHLASFVIMLPKQLKYSTFSSCFDSPYSVLRIHDLKFSLLYFFHILFHSTLFFNLNYSINHHSANYLSFYFEVSKPSRAFLVRYTLYNVKTIGDKQYLCITSLQIFIRLDSSWSSRTSTI